MTDAAVPRSIPAGPDDDGYEGLCACCGARSEFLRGHPSLREGYACGSCRASLRYRGQAELLLRCYGEPGTRHLGELVRQPRFAALEIFEPGVSGAFRPYFSTLPNYRNSFFRPDTPPGERRDGVECQDLERLTLGSDTLDLVVSSDILEHVRRPWTAFEEIHRVLRPGGRHVFSIPIQLPMRLVSRARVDTRGDEDLPLEEPRFHGDGAGGRSLVYTDFGLDLIERLLRIGFLVTAHRPAEDNAEAKRLVTFSAEKL